MAYRTVEESSLTGIADAIREAGGTGESLLFPAGFQAAISNMGGSGGTLTVTAPAGVLVSVGKDGKSKTKMADDSGIAVFKGLESGTWTVFITNGSETASKTVNIVADYATEISFNVIPEFAYTGEYEIVNDADEPISVSQDNWKIRFLTSGTLTFANLGNAENGIDVFLVGGGGGGSGGGGGGGYTKTLNGVSVATGTSYAISIGAGGTSSQDKGTAGTGGTTSAFDYSANGGYGGEGGSGKGNGGDGGSGGGGYGDSLTGKGGTDGGDGVRSTYAGGKGQGTTTREFAESGAGLYSSGGSHPSNNVITTANSGDGGGGLYNGNGSAAMDGASGIVVIRNAR